MKQNSDFNEHYQLRDRIFQALTENQNQLFSQLCRENREDIFQHFSDWQTVPPAIRESQSKVQWYARGLISVARFFADQGEMALLNRLSGKQPPPAAGSRQKRNSHRETEIIFTGRKGEKLTYRDLQGFNGAVDWQIVEKGYPIPPQARAKHNQGREAGCRGDYAGALKLFREAAALAPLWPYPPYDAAYTYLLQGEYDKALENYHRAEKLVPRGFFTLKTAVHTLEKEQKGELPAGTYLIYQNLENMQDPATRLAILTHLLEETPQFAPGWLKKAEAAGSEEERFTCIVKGLAADPDEETRGLLLINQATLLFAQGQKQDALAILGQLALDPAASLQNEHLAKALLYQWLKL